MSEANPNALTGKPIAQAVGNCLIISTAKKENAVERIATCQCGRVTLAVNGEPIRVGICSCRACQRRTGSTFGVQARYREADVVIEGEVQCFRRQADSGAWVESDFCANCGTTVLLRPEALTGMVSVPVGLFADTVFPRPTVAIYRANEPAWLKVELADAGEDPPA